jgi:hypothetical protein
VVDAQSVDSMGYNGKKTSGTPKKRGSTRWFFVGFALCQRERIQAEWITIFPSSTKASREEMGER